MAARKKKNKKKPKRGRPALGSSKLRSRLPPGTEIVPSGDGVKMSEVLMEFVEPYLEEGRTDDELRKLLSVACIAWNAALVSGAEREEMLRDMAKTLPPDTAQGLRSIIDGMIRRKEVYFARYKRFIIDFQLTSSPTGPHLLVASTVEGQ
jgi:hypothetical protein